MVWTLSSAAPTRGSGAEGGSHLACAVGRSTAYTNLRRILAVISSLPPPGGEIPSPPAQPGGETRPVVDLRLRLAPTWEEDQDVGLIGSAVAGGETAKVAEQIVSRSSSVGILGANSSTGRTPDGHGKVEEVEEDGEGRACSEITNVKGNEGPGESLGSSEEGRSPGDAAGNTRKNVKDGYLGLLLEAVRQISNEENKVATEKTERKGKGAAPGPVVRSKRGRSQVLPSKFRDSVLEPWSKRARRWRR